MPAAGLPGATTRSEPGSVLLVDWRGAWLGGVEQWCHQGTGGLQAFAHPVMERGSQMERLCRLSSEEAAAHLSCQTRRHREGFLLITYLTLQAPHTLGQGQTIRLLELSAPG